jgi:hypothetical protein
MGCCTNWKICDTTEQKDSIAKGSSHFQDYWTFWSKKDNGKFAEVCVLPKYARESDDIC